MYNPGLANRQRAEVAAKNGNVRVSRSSLLKRDGLTARIPDNKVNETYGFSAELAEVGNTKISYMLIFAGNSLGFGVSKGDFYFTVTSGSVYVIRETDTGNETIQINPGFSFGAKAGTKFGIATGNQDAEITATYHKKYFETLKLSEEPVVSSFTPRINNPAPLERTRSDVSLTLQQAREIRAQKDKAYVEAEARAEGRPVSANSADSLGVNPIASWPTEDD